LIICVSQYALDGPFEFAPGQHDSPPASYTTRAHIGSHPVYAPAITATGVRFSHLHNITNLNIHRHNQSSVAHHCADHYNRFCSIIAAA
jgi:hypothetical protein